MKKICKWQLTEEEWNGYSTSCGEIFCIEEGTPKDNKMNYCTYCSKKITIIPPEEDLTERR